MARLLGLVSSGYIALMVLYFVIRLLTGDSLWWIALTTAFVAYTFVPAFFFLAIAVMFGQWRTAARLSILAVVAVLWFGPFFQPKSNAPPQGTTIRVMTYNLHGDENSELAAFENWLRTHQPDVVALQEIPGAYREGIESLRDMYPEQVGEDIMLLSRYPINESRRDEDYLRAIIAVQDEKIAVYTLHFEGLFSQSPRLNLPVLDTLSRYDEDQRNQQIDRLVAALDGESIPYIVAGDFNLSQHSLKYSALAVRMTDSFRATNTGLGPTWSLDYGLPLLRIDYIWHGKGLRSIDTEIGPDLGSDHLPVIAVLEILETTLPDE